MTPFSYFSGIGTCVVVFLDHADDQFAQLHHVVRIVGLSFGWLGLREEGLLLVVMMVVMVLRGVLLMGKSGGKEKGGDEKKDEFVSI